MPENKKDVNPKSLLRKFADLFSNSSETVTETKSPTSITENNLIKEYALHEVSVLLRRTGVKDTTTRVNDIDSGSVVQALFPTHKELVGSVADAERLKALDGSLKQVENIIVSSIMSPNDLQDRDPTISFEDPSLTEEQKTACNKLFQQFYCEEYGLRERMESWVREAHFRSGAGVTLILPEASLASIISTYDPDRTCVPKSSTECFSVESIKGKLYNNAKIYNELSDKIYTEKMYDRVFSYDPYKRKDENEEVEASSEGIAVKGKNKKEKHIEPDTVDSNVVKTICNEIIEEYDVYRTKEDKVKLKHAVEEIAITINSVMKKKKPSMISKNPEILRFSKNFKDQMENQVKKNVLNLFDMQDNIEHIHNKRSSYVPVIDLSEHLTTYSEQRAYPFSVSIPAEATIPVCIPGNKKEHIGYLILIDKYGHPIEASTYLVGDNNCSISGRINSAYTAMYGSVPTSSGIRSPQGSFMGMSDQMIAQQQYHATQKIFNHILDNTLKNTVRDCTGLDDVSLGTYQSISICMLSRLLEKKETILVYVPRKYITYMAFDYKTSNGTGKSKLDDILFLESLKVSMLVSNVLATMKNAAPFKKATLELSKEQKNPYQIMADLRNAIAEKEKILPSINPTVVSQQILSQNTSIELRGDAQTTGFQISTEDAKRDLPTIDTDFLDKLDNQTITALGAPVSTVNEIAEVQYARSVATTNIFFAKTIKRDQDTLLKFVEEHVKTHASFSSLLINQLAAIIEKTDVKSGTSVSEVKETELIKENETVIGIISKKIDPEIYRQVLGIIDSIKITLPAPIVSPDIAHYELMDQAIKLVNEYVEAVFPDDLIPGEYNDELGNTYKAMRAHIKSNAQRELCKQLGMGGALDLIPTTDAYALQYRVNMKNQISAVRGVYKDIQLDQNQKKLTTEETNGDDSSGGGYNW